MYDVSELILQNMPNNSRHRNGGTAFQRVSKLIDDESFFSCYRWRKLALTA